MSKSQQIDPQEAVLGYAVEELKSDMKDIKTDLKEIRDCVIKVDKGMENYSLRTTNLERRVDVLEPEVKKSTGYMNKLAGGLIVISLIIQVIGPFVSERFFKSKHIASVGVTMAAEPSAAIAMTPPLVASTNMITGAVQVNKAKP